MLSFPRSEELEWLDRPDVEADLLCDNLRDIARYNTLLGTHALLLRLVCEVVGRAVSPSISPSPTHATGRASSPPVSVTHMRTMGRVSSSPVSRLPACTMGRANSPPYIGLDVGMGLGDFLRTAQRAGQGRWVGLDSAWPVLQCAQQAVDIPMLLGAGQRLPFPDHCFDVVTCAQTLHHLTPPQAIQLMRECARVARGGVVIIDLARGYIGLAGAWLLTRLTSRNAITRADGVQSVRRAYTPVEAQALAQQAGWAGVRLRRHGPIRYSLVWCKHG